MQQLSPLNNKKFLPGNIIPHVWYRKFCSKDGGADFVAITILADVVAWYRNGTSDYFGENAPKFDGKSLSVAYNYFEEKFGLHPGRTRRAFVRLEELSVLKRKVCNIQLEDGLRINRISITLKNSFLKSCFRDSETDLRSTDNDSRGGGRFDYSSQLLTTSYAFEDARDQVTLDHGCRDQIRNKTFIDKNRSTGSNFESNFCKNSLERKARSLKDFYPLSSADYRDLQLASRREFSLVAMNEILFDMSSRITEPMFYSKKGFLSYMAKAFAWEKRDAERINNESFRIRANYSADELDLAAQEKYLSEVENSLQTSPEWHLRKKIAAVFESSKACALLRAFESVSVVGSVCTIAFDRHVVLSDVERDLLFSQIKATHERLDLESESFGYIADIKIIMPQSKRSLASSSSLFSKKQNPDSLSASIPSGIWGEVRRKLINICGEATDRNWFSRLIPTVNEENRTIALKCASGFVKDWIEQNYLSLIERVIPGGFSLEKVVV